MLQGFGILVYFHDFAGEVTLAFLCYFCWSPQVGCVILRRINLYMVKAIWVSSSGWMCECVIHGSVSHIFLYCITSPPNLFIK